MQKRMPDHELPLQVQCEQCGRTAGAAIVQCPLRSEGNCRYQLSREWELSIRMRIAGGCVIVVAVVAVIMQSMAVGLFLILLGLIGTALGANQITVLYNLERGILWQHVTSFIGNKHVLVRMAIKTMLSNLNFGAFPTPHYPASITTLHGSSAGFIIKITLIDLLVKEVIGLCRVTIYEAKQGTPLQQKQVLLFTTGKNAEQPLNGDLENRIARAVKHIYQSATVQGVIFPQTISCYALVRSIYPSTHPDPGQWLISCVANDTVRLGLGEEKSPIFRQKRVVSRGNYGASLEADQQKIRDWLASPPVDFPRSFLNR